MKADAKILIVDDEEDIVEFLQYNLEKEGYLIETALNGKEAIEKASTFLPHLIVLDIMMPEIDGIEVCGRLRSDERFNETVIAFLTAKSESFTQITALEMGGDDFINKPIKLNVFKSRIKALLRRHYTFNTKNEEVVTFGDLKINFEQFSVELENEQISLAKKEFELLTLLTSKPGKVFKRSEILFKVWGNDVIVGGRTIDVHIRKLREKIGSHYIQTTKGVGYKFDF
jgi:two-component system alkaline phosphatase synthesis response regulator PhoP